MSKPADAYAPPVRHPWGYAVLAVVVLMVGVATAVYVSGQDRRDVSIAAARSFETATYNILDQTSLHLGRYEDLLASFEAAHRSHGSPRDERFGHFLGAKAAERRYAGHQAIVVKMRTPGTTYTDLSTAHVEPHFRTSAALGLTDANRPSVVEAMRQATETGQAAMTRPLPLDDDGTTNLALIAPLYSRGAIPATAQERRAAVIGWVAVVVRADQFFNDVLLRRAEGVGIEVFDGAPGSGERITAWPRAFRPHEGPSRLMAVTAPQRLWTLRMQPFPGRNGTEMSDSTLMLVAGILLSALLAAFIASLGGAKNRALRLVSERTGDLRRSEQRFRSLAASSPLGIFGLAAEGGCEYANERLCDLTGRTLAELQGAGLSDAYHPDDREALRKAVTGPSDRSAALRLRVLLPDGSLRWVKTHAAPLRDEGGDLTGWVGSVEDVTTEVQAQVASQQLSIELAHQARHDHLTGLANRPHFTEQVGDLLAGPDVNGVAVLFFDIDRFKVVNDSLGHDAGDRLLVAVAERLRTAVRRGDIAARFGGDEFVVGLVGITDVEQAAAQAQRLLGALNHTMILDDHEVNVTVSMGVALSDAASDAETLLTHADSAMYRAKARGKARFEVYRGAAAAGADTTLELERQLRQAIDHNQLRLMYQPIVSVPSADITGVEALVRWEHPEHGLLQPGDFIPLAEDSGLVGPLGAWVLRTACAQLQSWSSRLGGRPFYVTVNVSARQLADPLFPSVVATALGDFDIDPATICLEITESALLRDLDAAEQALLELRTIGVRIAIDDFGTGYSSLTHLKLLPIDMLKIDRSFVSELGENPDNTAIVGAVIRLAGALGMTSVAEGVEDAEQAEWLASLGCELAQGFYFAHPQHAELVELLLGEDPHADDIAASRTRPARVPAVG